MENDKKNKDVYPKLSENDKRWKQQDEFDSAGAQRQLEDEDANSTIPESTNNPVKGDEETDDASSGKARENSRSGRPQP
jgi:hypothetical protein